MGATQVLLVHLLRQFCELQGSLETRGSSQDAFAHQ